MQPGMWRSSRRVFLGIRLLKSRCQEQQFDMQGFGLGHTKQGKGSIIQATKNLKTLKIQ